MDSVAAQESSLEPLILAGYPQAQDITPTGLDAALISSSSPTEPSVMGLTAQYTVPLLLVIKAASRPVGVISWPQGAVAPKIEEMKTNAVAGTLGYGVRDVYKNTEDAFRVNDVTLAEKTTYVLYFFLTDAER